MNRDEVRAALTKLHAELESADAVDPELRELLREVDEDIHGLLADESEPEGLMERMELLNAKFAAEHPRAEGFVRELINALGRMGI